MSGIFSRALPRVPRPIYQRDTPKPTSDVADATSSSPRGRSLLLQSNFPCSFLPVGLSNAGFEPSIIPAREFTGSEDLRGVQVIVYAPDEKSHLNDSAQRRVKNFVYSGGGLVLFEWVTYHVERKKMASWSEFVPISRGGTGIGGTIEFSVVEPSHPITQGLPSKFAVLGGFSLPAVAHKGHVIVTCGTEDFPAVVVHKYGRGKIVHINCAPAFRGVDAFTYTSMQKLFTNAVLHVSTAHPLEQTPMLNYDESKMWCDAELISVDNIAFPIHLAFLSTRCPLLYRAVLESEVQNAAMVYQALSSAHSMESGQEHYAHTDVVDDAASESSEPDPALSLEVLRPRLRRQLHLPCKADAMEFLISYLYTERMEASGDHFEKEKLGVDLSDLIPIASQFNMNRMHAALLKLMADLWNMKTIMKVARKLALPEYIYLKRPAFEYMLRHYKQIVVDTENLQKLDKDILIELMQAFYEPKKIEILPILVPPTKSLVADLHDLFIMASSARDANIAADVYLCDFTIRFDMTRSGATNSESAGSASSSSPADSPVVSPRRMVKSPSMPQLGHDPLEQISLRSEPQSGFSRSISATHLPSAGTVEIFAHKFVLASRSRFFEALFRSHMRDSDSEMLVSPEAGNATQPPPTAFRSFLQYLYTNEVAISPQDAIYFLDATEYYGLQDDHFERQCRQVFSHGLSAENVLQTYARAHSVHNEYVKETALDFIAKNFAAVSAQSYLHQLDKDLLLEIIQTVALNARHQQNAHQQQQQQASDPSGPTAPHI